jgi:hypothetical protein
MKNPAIFEQIILDTQDRNHSIKTEDNTRLVFPLIPRNAAVSAKTDDYTVVASDMNKIISNAGSSKTIVLTLPAVASCKGDSLLIHALAAQILRPTPATGEAIALNGSVVVTKYLNIAGVIGNYVELYSDGSIWHVVGYAGVVTKEG